MNIAAARQRDLAVGAQRELAARTAAVIVGVDLAGIDRQRAGADIDAAAAAEPGRVADIELGAALDAERAKTRRRHARALRRVDRHLANARHAGNVDRAGGRSQHRLRAAHRILADRHAGAADETEALPGDRKRTRL